MTAKEELKQFKFKRKNVELILDEYEKFETRAEKITAVISQVSAHSNKISDKVGDNAVVMADIIKKYAEALVDSEQECFNLKFKIAKLHEPFQTILVMRYIHDKSFEDIASELGYSYKQILRLHGTALKKFEDL